MSRPSLLFMLSCIKLMQFAFLSRIQDCMQVGCKMVVLNLSQQTDSSDLLGGFKPVPAGKQMMKLLRHFQELFTLTFTKGKNDIFLARILKLAHKEKWQNVIQALYSALTKVTELEAQQTKANSGDGQSKTGAQEGNQMKRKKRKQIIPDSLR